MLVQACHVDGLQPTVASRVLNHKEKNCVVAVQAVTVRCDYYRAVDVRNVVVN